MRNVILKSGRINNLERLKTYRKELRLHQTPAEVTLWDRLRNSQLEGRKFRRQHSVGNYILDFYCTSEKLAVELDGKGHDESDQTEYDDERDSILSASGIKVLRFENRIVFDNSEWLLNEIKKNFGWGNK
jgi:very-short-patch-repair endonuclease